MDLKKLINQSSSTLLDVREPKELINEGEVPGALLIPVNEIPERIEEIKKLSTPLIIFCRSGVRSAKVVEYLKNMGLQDIYNGGGFKDINSMIDI